MSRQSLSETRLTALVFTVLAVLMAMWMFARVDCDLLVVIEPRRTSGVHHG